MAYMSQEQKKSIASKLKAVVPKSWKYTLSVRNHSTIVFTLVSSPVDFLPALNAHRHERGGGPLTAAEVSHFVINRYWYKDHLATLDADSLATIEKIFSIMNEGNHDRSDIQADYFDVGWYISFNVGRWDKPYIVTGK